MLRVFGLGTTRSSHSFTMNQTCKKCRKAFLISSEELSFSEFISPKFNGNQFLIPPPTLCPQCRQQARLVWRNERALYERNCNLCRKRVISMYRPNTPYRVYCESCFWSGPWNPLEFGRSFDFSRPFFDQFAELLRSTPLVALINVNTKNSEYCNRIYDGRDNYLAHIALYGPESLMYTYYTMRSQHCVDVTYTHNSEYCYEVTDAEKCNECFYSNRIENCSRSYFLEDCTNCSFCFGCKNLVNCSYCIFNKQYTREEYLAFLEKASLDNFHAVEEWRRRCREFFNNFPVQNIISRNCKNVSGCNVFDCEDSVEIYDMHESRNLRYCAFGENCENSMDCYGFGDSKNCYNSIALVDVQDVRFTVTAVHSSDLLYSYECYANSNHCFGCCGLKGNSYCILNRQYSRDEYQALMPRIIEHMRGTGEWGSFFPGSISPFAYNETVAFDYYPLSPERAFEEDYKWYERTSSLSEYDEPFPCDRRVELEDFRDTESSPRVLPTTNIAGSIRDLPDEILNWELECKASGKTFRVQPQELEFYRKFHLPLPRYHPDERHRHRLDLRYPRMIWETSCACCRKSMESSFKPGTTALVYCQSCYGKALREARIEPSDRVANLV